MSDWTYKDALIARLGRVYDIEVRPDVDRCLGDDERARLDQWHEGHPGGIEEFALSLQRAFQALAEGMNPLVDAFVAIADQLRDMVGQADEPQTQKHARPLPVRQIPLCPPPDRLYDQRPEIRRFYARQYPC